MSHLPFPFEKGQRVRLTVYGISQRLAPWGRKEDCLGTVVAVQGPFGVKVLRDGMKEAHSYHVDFWRIALDKPR